MSDMIYREDAIDVLEKLSACEEYGVEVGTDEETYIGKYEAIIEIRDLPSANRPQGAWKSVKASIYPYGYDVECSVCGFRMGSSFGYKYCPNCGAKMDGEREDE